MTWARLDDNFHDHPKVTKLLSKPKERLSRLAAVGLWTLARTWSARQQTNGAIPQHLPAILTGDPHLAARLTALLVDAGLWDIAPDLQGWTIHDSADYGSELSAKRAEAGRKGAQARWQTDAVANGNPEWQTDLPSDGKMARARGPGPSRTTTAAAALEVKPKTARGPAHEATPDTTKPDTRVRSVDPAVAAVLDEAGITGAATRKSLEPKVAARLADGTASAAIVEGLREWAGRSDLGVGAVDLKVDDAARALANADPMDTCDPADRWMFS